jgi:hypothetical protein
MRGQLLLTVYFEGGRTRPLTEARRILKHFGKDVEDKNYSYSITRHVASYKHEGKKKTSVRSIGMVITFYVDDVEQSIAHAKTLDNGKQISHIDVDVVLDLERYLHLKGR